MVHYSGLYTAGTWTMAMPMLTFKVNMEAICCHTKLHELPFPSCHCSHFLLVTTPKPSTLHYWFFSFVSVLRDTLKFAWFYDIWMWFVNHSCEEGVYQKAGIGIENFGVAAGWLPGQGSLGLLESSAAKAVTLCSGEKSEGGALDLLMKLDWVGTVRCKDRVYQNWFFIWQSMLLLYSISSINLKD